LRQIAKQNERILFHAIKSILMTQELSLYRN